MSRIDHKYHETCRKHEICDSALEGLRLKDCMHIARVGSNIFLNIFSRISQKSVSCFLGCREDDLKIDQETHHDPNPTIPDDLADILHIAQVGPEENSKFVRKTAMCKNSMSFFTTFRWEFFFHMRCKMDDDGELRTPDQHADRSKVLRVLRILTLNPIISKLPWVHIAHVGSGPTICQRRHPLNSRLSFNNK